MNDTTLLRYADPALAPALAASFLAGLRPAILEELVRRGVVTHIGADRIFIEDGQLDWAGIMLLGMARVYLTTRDGRQIMLRHANAGGAVGIPTVVGQANPVRVATVTECRLLRLDTGHLRDLAQREVAVAWALATEVTQRLLETCAEVELRSDTSVRQRVARALVHLAQSSPDKAETVVLSSQEALAQSLGTAREVVSKVLRELQARGIIRLGRGLTVITDLDGLRAAAEQASWRESIQR